MTQVLTIPTVYSNGNKMIQENANILQKELEKSLNDGFTISHIASAAMNNVLYVTYVLIKQ